MKFGRPRTLNVAQQYVNLKANPVSSGSGRIRAGRFAWTYDLSPSTLSRNYGVRIEMAHDLSPDVSSRRRTSMISPKVATCLTFTSKTRRDFASISRERQSGAPG